MCMSLHQPYASLMVAGIKRVEGRGWPSNFTGYLYIHAGSHKMDESDFQSVLDGYAHHEKKRFPKNYPTSCLLGRVFVLGQLSNEDYRAKCPQIVDKEESHSDFVFLTSHCQSLMVPIRQSGEHKIWKLPGGLFKSAKTAIEALY